MAYPLIHRDNTIQTLGHALRTLSQTDAPILRYRQHISLRAPFADLCYTENVQHDRVNEILHISFPTELVGVVSNLSTSHNARIVTYIRDPVTDFIREVQVKKETVLHCWRNRERPVLRIYTRGIEDLIVSFDVWMFKGAFFRSAL